jgi:hypothetical protein
MKIDHSLWKIRRNKMSKKKLLKESTIRRFGGLAGIKPVTTSNFLNEFGEPVYMREEEEEEGMEIEDEEVEMDIEEEPVEDELAIEEPAPEGGADDLVMSLLDKVKEWASEQGVEMDVDGEGEGGEEMDMELGGEEELDLEMGDEDVDLEMGDEEETLEEMINSVLSEEEEEDIVEAEEVKKETVQVVDDESVIQEVTKRVKQRLARIAKSQRRRK